MLNIVRLMFQQKQNYCRVLFGLNFLAERLIFSAKASCVSERLMLISRILFPKFFFIDIVTP